jgi:hypothetical protein
MIGSWPEPPQGSGHDPIIVVLTPTLMFTTEINYTVEGGKRQL